MKKNNKQFIIIAIVILVLISLFLISRISKNNQIIKEEQKKIALQEEKQKAQLEEKKKEEKNKTEEKEDNNQEEMINEFFSKDIEPKLKELKGNPSLGFIDLESNSNQVLINNKEQKAASVIKLFILSCAFDEKENGKLDLEEKITAPKDPVAGSYFIEANRGKEVTIKQILDNMIKKSDNEATNIMIEKLGMDKINTYIQKIGAKQTKLQRKMLDSEKLKQNIDNMTSVKDVSTLLKKIYKGEILKSSKEEILDILSGNERRSKIPAQIDTNDVKIYNKTGEFSDYNVQNDAAIVKTEKGAYVLVELLVGDDNAKEIQTIADTSKKIFDFYTEKLKSTPPKKEQSSENKPTKKVSKGKKVAIDPGHQLKGNYEKETVAPSSKEMKAKTSSGTQGVVTKVPEYQYNLDVAMMVKDALEKEGYEVFMTRTTNDVNLSNQDRARMVNESNSDVYIRIHANGGPTGNETGVQCFYATEQNPDVGKYSKDSGRLSKLLVDSICKETGAKNNGITATDVYSGTNFANLPTTIVETGYMSNPQEDRKLNDPEYRKKIVKGIVEGINQYFGYN